jgi:hypothetical protein
VHTPEEYLIIVLHDMKPAILQRNLTARIEINDIVPAHWFRALSHMREHRKINFLRPISLEINANANNIWITNMHEA